LSSVTPEPDSEEVMMTLISLGLASCARVWMQVVLVLVEMQRRRKRNGWGSWMRGTHHSYHRQSRHTEQQRDQQSQPGGGAEGMKV
jgi:hypothetical protein